MLSARLTLAGSPSISRRLSMSWELTLKPFSINRMFSSRVPKRLSIPRTICTLAFIYMAPEIFRLRMGWYANRTEKRGRHKSVGQNKPPATAGRAKYHLELIIAKGQGGLKWAGHADGCPRERRPLGQAGRPGSNKLVLAAWF